jgi:hypothetical protein
MNEVSEMPYRNSKAKSSQRGQNMYDGDHDETTFTSKTLKLHFTAYFKKLNYYINFNNYVPGRYIIIII